MKKLVVFLMTFVLLVSQGMTVMAGTINDYEAALIEIGNGVFEYNGVEYVATEAAKQRVVNYLMQDDIDLNAEQAAEAEGLFWGNIASGISNGYLVPLNPPEEESTEGGSNGGGTTGGNRPSGGGSSSGGSSSGGNSSSDNSSSGDSQVTVVAPESAYTFTEMRAEMCAKQNVNVRNQPSTSGERIGSLTENQEVTVVAQCVETGWYCILYNGTVAYVSDNYLIEKEPAVDTEVADTETETQVLETELVTEEAETEVETQVETETETESEAEEVILREKHFNKGLNVTTVAIITGGIALGAAVIIVLSHKNRRY